MQKKTIFTLFSPVYPGTDKDSQTFGALFKNLFMITLGFLGFVFCMTLLSQAMRGVMDLGGFVASGGPYEIAHPAPGWIWVFPVSILAGLVFLLLYSIFAKKIGGIKLERRYKADAPTGVAGRNSDNTFIKSVLNWEPDTPLEKGMEATYHWIETQYFDRKAGKRTVS